LEHILNHAAEPLLHHIPIKNCLISPKPYVVSQTETYLAENRCIRTREWKPLGKPFPTNRMCVNCSGSGSAKMPVFQIRESCVQEHVLIIAPEPLAEALVAASTNKGALCQVAFDINDAAHHARNKTYDVIIVRARDNAGATALLLRLLRAAQPDSRLFLLLESNQATELGDCSLQADELLSISLSDERIIAAVGLGIMMSANNGMAVAA
jgi:hypothetical protein